MDKSILSLLNWLPFLNASDEDQSASVLEYFDISLRSMAAKDVIFRQGDPDCRFVFGAVISGRVQMISYDFLGSRTIVAEYPRRRLFNLESLEQDKAQLYSFVAAEPSQIARFRIREQYRNDAAFYDTLFHLLRPEFIKNRVQAERHLAVLCNRTLRGRILFYLTEEANEARSREFDIRFSRQELADYLCVDRSSLARELRRLKDEGVLDFSGSRFRLCGKEF